MKIMILNKFTAEALKACQIEYKNLNLTDKRFRWDVWNACQSRDFSFTCDALYKYVNDDHIDTALKNLMKDITE